MNNLQGPPTTHDDYVAHVQVLSGLLHKVPFDDRLDLLQSALARACARWEPARSPWKPWIIGNLRWERGRYFRNLSDHPTFPFPDDLQGRDDIHQFLSNLDLGLLLARLAPRQRRALLARRGGKIAHLALRQLRRLATQNPKQPRRCSDVS